MAKCPICKQWLTGFNWTKTKNGKNWLKNNNGDWHDCPKNQDSYSKSDHNKGFEYNPTFDPSYTFCGKCATLCDKGWCSKCEMYPSVTFSGKTEEDNKWFSSNPEVEALQDTNKSQIMEEYRGKYDNVPINGLWMNKDGSMPTGYKLTPELTKWYEKDGKSMLKELYSKIWYKKRERLTV